jgi:integrase
LEEESLSLLKSYLETYFHRKPDESYIMFSRVDDMARPITNISFNNALKKIVKGSGLETQKKITARSFMEMVATEGYKDGLSLKELQLKLNHKTTNQTSASISWCEIPSKATWLPDLGTEFHRLNNSHRG